ncbi:hypothetical protein PR048_022854 [Dryococelus australis]|uniref:Uncharacterized protein n=1 Tax=Dryococelus australis TaxID=614101 RepID=A0ABQ9GSJ3_9NEOP|nr:hypothetical protein PR048_022854 [Dryococelus australis]
MFSFNVWVGIIGDCLIGHFLPQWLNEERYLRFLWDNLPMLLDIVPLQQHQKMWFMHDGLPAHFLLRGLQIRLSSKGKPQLVHNGYLFSVHLYQGDKDNAQHGTICGLWSDYLPPTKAKTGLIPGRFTPEFSHVGIVPDNAAGRLIFSKSSHFSSPFILALLHT